jgi:predicted AAA+ superfamily ATPase
MVHPFKKTVHRKAVSSAKFYFFDIGVANILASRSHIVEKSELFGRCFEHFIFTELRAFLDYSRDRRPLQFWRDYDGHEVDFLLGDTVGIEAKGTSTVSNKHLKNLRILGNDIDLRHKVVVSLDPSPRLVDDIEILPWRVFLTRLWNGDFGADGR